MPLLDHLTVGAQIKFPAGTAMSVNPIPAPAETSTGAAQIDLEISQSGVGAANRVRVLFLPHGPGAVNYHEGADEVLSGIFTGCYMAAYRAGAQRRVAHVHTGTDGVGRDCKAFMRELCSPGGHTLLANFKPFDGNRDGDAYTPEIQASPLLAPGVFGLITAGDQLHSIYCRKESLTTFVVSYIAKRATQPLG